MHIDPHRHDDNDQPWPRFSGQHNAAMAAFGIGPVHPLNTDQPFLSVPCPAPGSMILELQPRHGLSCGSLRAAEASLRTPPADPDSGKHMSAWLLQAACHEAQDWNAMQAMSVMVSVNLAGCLLRRDLLVSQTRRALARSGLLPWRLELQLPEQAVIDADADMLLSLAALRDLDVGLGLDRFGTLAASPRALQRLPLTSVKLDPVLTRDVIQDRATRAAAKAAIALAHALGATVLATGVKNPTQRDILADLGCDDAQGPLFGGLLRPEVFHASLLAP